MKIRPYLLFACVIALFATAPILHASSTGGLILDSGGSITSTPSEVIDGTRSIKGFSSGTTSFTPVLRSDPTRLPFQRNQTYRITFRYKILSSSDQGLNVYFYSSTAGAQGSFVPGQTVSGSPGTSGTLSLTATLGPFDDYVANWSFQTAGSVVIDDVQIVNASTGARSWQQKTPSQGPNSFRAFSSPPIKPRLSGESRLRLLPRCMTKTQQYFLSVQ